LTIKSVAVFAGANRGEKPEYLDHAGELGRAFANANVRVIFGGGHVGLMGAVADSALAAGGEVIGVMPQFLVEREIAHSALTELVVVETMHERKAQMMARSDAFVALPGGSGTLEELFEAWTWTHVGLHAKPCALFNVAGFYTPLVTFLRHATTEGFVKQVNLDDLIVDADPARLLARLIAAPAPAQRW
jgi:uncharacterized protein (TIGR00730 family)